MKVKNLFITFGLSLALGVVAAVGAGQKVEKAEANAGDILSGYQLVGAGLGIGWNDGANNTYRFTEQADGSYKWTGAISVERFRVTKGDGSWTTMLNWNNVEDNCDGKFVKASTVTDDGDNNIWCNTAGDYHIVLNAAKTKLSFSVAEAVVYHTVTKYAVLDGVKQGETYGEPEEIVAGSTYAVPGRITWSGYHFGGWFTNEACTSAYSATSLDADLTLYAKFTTLSKDSYIYYVTGSESATPNMIHTWGGDVEYANKDVTIVGITGVAEVHGVLQFRGTAQLIYKIPYSTESEDTAFKFHYNNWASESPEKALAAGSAYYWSAEDGYDAAAAGDALDFLLAAEVIRNAVRKANGAPADYSVCGISVEDAAELCSDYNKLSEKARGYVDTTNVHTYNPEVKLDVDPEHQTEVTYLRVMQELAAKAGVSLAGHSASRLVPTSSTASNNIIIIVIIASALVLITVAGCFLIKRKHN